MTPGIEHGISMRGISMRGISLRSVAMLGVSMLLAGALAAEGAAAEWRSWCGGDGSGVSLGWHFYCDREEAPEPEARAPAPAPAAPSATERVLEIAPRAGRGPRGGGARSDAGEGGGLSASPTGNPREGRGLLRRLPAHGLGDAGARLQPQAPGRRARQAALAGRAQGIARPGAGKVSASATA